MDSRSLSRFVRPGWLFHAVLICCLLFFIIWTLVSIAFMEPFQIFFQWLTVTGGLLAGAGLWNLFVTWRRTEQKLPESDAPEPGSLFKPLAIPLPGFRFHHEPYRRESTHRNFFGRDELSAKFLAILNHSQNFSGSYLVSGYRGVGKTSFVHKVLEDYRHGVVGPRFGARHGLFDGALLRLWLWLYLGFGRLQLLYRKWATRLNRAAFVDRNPLSPVVRTFAPLCQRYAPLRRILLFLPAAFLLTGNPRSSAGMNLLLLILFLGIPLLILLFRRFGIAIFYPRQWWRWMFRPVVTVQINLGHERLETKRILFDIATLLRLHYRNGVGLLAVRTSLKLLVLILVALWAAQPIHDTLKEEHRFAEHNLQNAVFEIYVVTPGIRSKISNRLQASGFIGPPDPWINRLSDETYVGRESLRQEVIRAFGDEQQGEHHFDLVEGYTYSSMDLDSKIIDSLCHRFRKEHEPPQVLTQEPTWIPNPLQRAYCLLDLTLEDLYHWVGDSHSRQTKYACPSEEENKNHKDSKPYCGSWIRFLVRETLALLEYEELPTVPAIPGKESQQPHALKAGVSGPVPHAATSGESTQQLRPYHLLVYLITMGGILLLYRLLLSVGPGRVIRRLKYIHDRIVASESVEVGLNPPFGLGLGIQRRRNLQPLDSRQAESLILDALETNHRLWPLSPRADIIFVFDELDKINPTREIGGENGANDRELSPGEAIRRRKFEVEQLLSNLKNLITVAPCRFIFIAGRDMMDADLADQGQVNHLYSSLFEETFYVPSFLTDHSDTNEEDISSMVEQYVCRRLLPRPLAVYFLYKTLNGQPWDILPTGEMAQRLDSDYNRWKLPVYIAYLKAVDPKQKETWDILGSFLQDFVYYLTYRSSGSPKKLALHFEHFVHPYPANLSVRRDPGYDFPPPIGASDQFILRFDERDQYQVQLISHTFIMLHGETSHLIRQYGDKLSLSAFSILDYLFKFHAVAFGSPDLERMPDVLDIHRAPALPQVIDILLHRTLSPHLRRVSNGLYEYRFIQHFQPEVDYISQFSERDLAAFNFTLDESITIKQHYRELLNRQIEQLSRLRSAAARDAADSQPDLSETLPGLYEILGDLSGLDHEYGEALVEYRNALHYLGPGLDRLEPEGTERPRFSVKTSPVSLLMYVRILLKMGLIGERRNQYSTALARYFQATRAVDQVLNERIGRRFAVGNFTQLTLLLQPMLCMAYLHAKRDPLPGVSDRLMNDLLKKTRRFLTHEPWQQDGERIPWDIPSDQERRHLSASLATRWAEVRVMRSRFHAAAIKYVDAIETLRHLCIAPDKLEPNRDPDILRDLGFNLSGLADCCCALVGYRHYLSKAAPQRRFVSVELDIPKEVEYREILDPQFQPKGALAEKIREVLWDSGPLGDDREWENCQQRSRVKGRSRKPGETRQQPTGDCSEAVLRWMGKKALRFYLLSAAAYRIANEPAEAALSFSKLQYFVVFGMGFTPLMADDIVRARKEPIQYRERANWLLSFRYEPRMPGRAPDQRGLRVLLPDAP